MAGLYLDGLGAHPPGHEALKVWIDGAVFGRNGTKARLGSPGGLGGLAESTVAVRAARRALYMKEFPSSFMAIRPARVATTPRVARLPIRDAHFHRPTLLGRFSLHIRAARL